MDSTGPRRRLPVLAVIGLVIAWLVAGIVGALIGRIFLGPAGEEMHSVASIAEALMAPQIVMIAFTLVVVRRLGWGRRVWREEDRAQAWVWIAPGALVVTSLAITDWSRVASAGPALVVALLVGVLMVGISEELMYRGIVLTALRDRWGELAAVLVTTALFSLGHAINGLQLNPLQTVATFCGGYVFYLTRRVSGSLWAAIAVHAMLDFSLFSITLGEGSSSDNAAPAVLFVEVLLFVVFLALFGKIRKPAREGELEAEASAA